MVAFFYWAAVLIYLPISAFPLIGRMAPDGWYPEFKRFNSHKYNFQVFVLAWGCLIDSLVTL